MSDNGADSTSLTDTHGANRRRGYSGYWKGFCPLLFLMVVAFVQLNSQIHTLHGVTSVLASGAELFASARGPPLDPYTCPFRDYDNNPNRFYGLTSENYPPAFLRASFYIYGKPPILLPVLIPTSGGKVCSRLRNPGEVLVMDGTNPSLLSLERLGKEVSPDNFPAKQLLARESSAMYLVSSTFKRNNQCQYFGENMAGKKTMFKGMEGRETKDADLLIVDSNMRTLWQSHIWEAITVHEKNATHYSADDVRLFVHDGEIWIGYKRYGVFGKAMRINRLRLQFHPTSSESALIALADSSEEIEICCGRNFGALSAKQPASPISTETSTLSFLTWPDPVWLQSLNTREILSNGAPKKVNFEDPDHIKSHMPNKKPSEFHGTSNHLLYIVESDEYFGIGHMHRERRWHKNPRKDAAYGHHYTHAFFTMSGKAPHQLVRLSQEFVFPSKVANFSSDADVVQFASGLEWVPSSASSGRRQIAISYGINDCEGAIVTLDWTTVESMLIALDAGIIHVAHTMKNISREEFVATSEAKRR